MSFVSTILLILASFAAFTVETCVNRRCPIGQFYNVTTGSCVSSCSPNYGDWNTGRCLQGNMMYIYCVYLCLGA